MKSMKNFKEKVIREIISMGKKNLKFRMPALVLAAIFLVIYHIVRDFFMQFTKHPVVQRVIVGILIVALLTGQIGTLNVFASTDAGIVISGFSELPEEIREQSVPVGTAPEMLVLPDTLEAVVLTETKDPEETASPAPTEDAKETASPTPTQEAGEIVSPAPTASASEEDPEGTASPEYTESPVPTQKPEEEKDQGETPEEIPDTEENTDSQESEDQETGEQESAEQAEDTKDMETETVEVSLEEAYSSPSENLSIETLTLSTSEPESEEQAEGVTDTAEAETITEAIMIEGVTWTSSPEFDSETVGEYTFTAVLPQGYILAEGVSLPQIMVTVADEEQTVVPQISGWHFDEENVAPKGELFYDAGIYSFVLAGGSSEVQIPFADIASVLPESVMVKYADLDGTTDGTDGITETDTKMEEVLSILGWSCPEYVEDEEGSLPYSGSFFFRALLGEDGKEKEYAFSEGVEQVGVWVVFDTPMLLSAVTAAPGKITSNQEWGAQTLTAGTYTINPGVTVTVSGRLTVSGAVTINGGGRLVRAGSYAGISNKNGSYSALLYLDNSGETLTLENITIDGNSIDAYGPAVYMASGTVVNLNNGAVIQNNYNMNTSNTAGTYAGGGIHCESGTLNIDGGTIKNCKTEGSVDGSLAYTRAGGGVYLKGTCNMTAGSITGNSASNGGGIYLSSKETTLNLTGGIISGNYANGDGDGVYYSTEDYDTSKLYIGGNANVKDIIFLDNRHGTLWPFITSKINYKVTLDCSSTEEGKILAEGSGYTLTSVDASKISMVNSGLYSKLDAANNRIILSTTEEAEAEWQESSGGAWKTGKFTTALKNVYSGGTIRLLKDIVFTEKVEISKTVTITSKNTASPRTITRMPEGNYGNITLTGSGNLTLTNVIYDGNRNYINSEGEAQSLIKVEEGTTLTLGSGCTICDGYKSGGSGVIAVYGTMTMNSGAVIKNCEVSGTGGAVWISSSGAFTMNGGTIQSCKAEGGGAAISLDGSCNLNGGSITGNTDSSDKNCAVYLRASGSGSLTLKGVTISGNTYSVYNDGKSVYIAGDSILSGSIYTTNAVKASGSGVSGLTKTYSIEMSSVTNGTTVVTGSRDNTHYQLESSEYTLIPASNATNLIAAGKYTVTYNKNGGTIAGESNYTSYTYGKGLTLPTPTRQGYIFGGWYTNSGLTGNAVTSISTTDTGNKTYYAKWTAGEYTVTFNYQGATSGNKETSRKVAYGSQYGTLPTPAKTGYTFKGWYTQTGGTGDKITGTTVMNKMNNHTLYAYWKDETAPNAPALQSGVTLPSGWTNTQKTIPLTLSDGVGVTELWVRIDSSNYQKVSGFSSGSKSYSYSVREGEHTYQFYAKDAAGNSSAKSAVFTVSLDTAKPVIGELTYENQAANLWQWIIGKTSLLIHVPVTDEGSGVTKISYTMMPADAGGQQETKTASVKSGKATISFDKDFRGTITITCTDTVGNSADSVTINADGGGVIVEDNAPKISFSVNGGAIAGSYYDAAPDILVSVVDDTDNTKSLVTGGIKSVTYEINGIQKEDGRDYTASMVTNSSFTIAAGEIPTGETLITVTATDHAGNRTEESVTVKVKGREGTPDAKINYASETLTGLTAGAEYTVNNAGRTADENGMISIEESWLGTTISIVKKSSTIETLDSASQELGIPARPKAPVPALASCTDTRITLQTLTGAEYRLENGTWQSDAVFSGLTPKTRYTFEAYYPATSGSFSSRTGSAVLATRSSAPDADSARDLVKIDYEKETLSLPEGVEAFKDAACTQPIDLNDDNSVADYIGGAIYIRYPADGDFPESEAIPVSIKSRPAVPASVGGTDETYPNAGDGTITGLTEGTAYEISSDGGRTWTDAVLSGTEIKGLVPGSYQVRVKAGENNFQGEASGTITIGTTQPTAETIPQAGIDYGQDALTGLAPGEKYEVSYTTQDGTEHTQECTADADGNIKFDEDWHGKTIEIVKQGNGMDKTDSTPQSLSIPARPKAPVPSVTGESVNNLTPGETYQISEDGGITWRDVIADDDGQIKNLAPGNYEIRIKDTDNTFSSESVKFRIKAYSPASSNPGSGEDDAGESSGTGDDPGTENNAGTGNISGTGNSGMIRKEVEKNENVPDTQFFMTTDELAAVVLTDSERQSVKSGTDVKILLIVEDASDIVSSQDKAVMDQAKGKFEIGQYLNISLVKIIGDSREEIAKTNGMVRITISVPDELKNTSSTQTREFAVIRVHNGEAVILSDLDTDEDTVTIETNLFSSYALLYRDVSKNGSARDNEPKTGDNTHPEWYATAGMIAGFAYLLQYFGDGKCGMTEEEKKALISKIIRWAHRGGKFRRNLALAVVFLLLVYYHSIGKRVAVKWNEVYGA